MGGKQWKKERERERFFSDLGSERPFLERSYGLPHPTSRGSGRSRFDPRRRTAKFMIMVIWLVPLILFLVLGAIALISRLINAF